MTQKEKRLILIDLCGRLPHGVIYHRNDGANIELREIDIENETLNYTDNVVVRECKPYLRPMSSMTEEEINEFIAISDTVIWLGDKRSTCILSLKQMDWLNKKMFDYRGLIPMGLALEAKKEMYKTE